MSLEFSEINFLQIQVTTKNLGSWIHYWTMPLMFKIYGWKKIWRESIIL